MRRNSHLFLYKLLTNAIDNDILKLSKKGRVVEMKKQITGIHSENRKYGVIGKKTGFETFRVGDLVVFEMSKGKIISGIICERLNYKEEDGFGVMGLLSTDLSEANIRLKVLDCELVTDEILKKHGLKTIDYIEEMTKAQIESDIN
jgi:hypothetical protein